MSINQIVTPLDSAVLETKEQYSVYFKIINHAFSELVSKIAQHNICSTIETTFMEQYCELLLYSLEAFRVKYLFDSEEKMKVDLTESGFPNYLEFRYLLNDLELKNEHISKLPKVEELKAEFLETLLKNKEEISERKLHQAASIVYYNSVEQKFIFKRFVQGKIIANVGTAASEGEYMVSWSFYDVTYNRPFICFMYFDLYKTSISEYTQQIYEVLETVADRDMSMDMMAYAIDKKLPKVWPKKLKKVDMGPFHNVFAKDELEITHVILKGIIEKNLDLSAFALSLTIKTTNSTGNFSEGNIFNKQYLQVWENSKPQKYVFTSHRVMQTLYDQIPDTLHALTQDPIEISALTL
ncbi:hypothetical protein [Ulvibacter litoralis]|uniref:Uncharacterized protein n=1 Tax=Ulvibacter litoralis TaxID=227084 RepID=A0A1G7C4H0_9FLAO|nr:hypothetical protein [Ulvibacter litoralis]GHC48844.1 hypothetical protein GCM10008083_10330 [Ulvibacter litoralis]SDE33670.1 hypothetical protein SAMN05421855_101154 [Ulvibacter litoralis]